MKITNDNVYNLDQAIRASKFPMAVSTEHKNSDITPTVVKLGSMERGSGHDNFLHGILVSFDLTCSNKMWVEFQRYHFADIVSSQSTMHRAAQLLEEDVFNKYVDDGIKSTLMQLIKEYDEVSTKENYLKVLYNIPSGIELTAHIVTNYGQLKTIYLQRYNHRLPEWNAFCDWILGLPKFCELTGITKGEKDE